MADDSLKAPEIWGIPGSGGILAVRYSAENTRDPCGDARDAWLNCFNWVENAVVWTLLICRVTKVLEPLISVGLTW